MNNIVLPNFKNDILVKLICFYYSKISSSLLLMVQNRKCMTNVWFELNCCYPSFIIPISFIQKVITPETSVLKTKQVSMLPN